MFAKACVHVINHIFLAFLILTLGTGEAEKVGPWDIDIPRPFLVSLVYKVPPLFEEKSICPTSFSHRPPHLTYTNTAQSK